MESEKDTGLAEQKDLYCLSCGHIYRRADGIDTCPECGAPLSGGISKEEAKKLSVKVHDDRTKATEKWNSAMCFVVLGAIGLIIGSMFTVLSLQKVRNDIVGIRFASFEFVVAALALAIGAAAFVYGIVKVIKAKKAINRANREITAVSQLYPKSKAN